MAAGWGAFWPRVTPPGVELVAVTPGRAGRWIDTLPVGPLAKNQALTALRRFCDGLVTRHVIALNPFLSVRFQKYQAVEGRTPEITRGQIQQLFRAIDSTTLRRPARPRHPGHPHLHGCAGRRPGPAPAPGPPHDRRPAP